ncbi:MAG TPA: AI-2E family transporter [Anaerolineales bacterium]|nr:AI-2E family transporter [Anaerolineales bacterium]
MTQASPRTSPRWSTSAKLIVALTAVVVVGALVIRFQAVLQLLVVAGILTFLMVPIVRLLNRKARLSWRLSTHLVYFLLLLVIFTASTATSLALIQQGQSLFSTVQVFLASLPEVLQSLSERVYTVGPWQIDLRQFDLAPMAQEALATLRPLLGQASGLLASLAAGAFGYLSRLVFVLAASYFLTLDQPRLQNLWDGAMIPGYEDDLRRLRRALEAIWSAFLRGQVILALIVGLIVWIVLTILGVRYSGALALLAGLLEFMPILGPFLAAGVTGLVALLQGGNPWGLTQPGFVLLVIGAFTLIQQLENNLLVPRILGDSLNMRPVIVLVAAIVGASLAGILGLLLSAPTTATLWLLGRYAYRKIFDLSPWEPPIDTLSQPSPRRRWTWFRRRQAEPEPE